MEKYMGEIHISTERGCVTLMQPVHCNDDAMIIRAPDQIDVLIAWLGEAKIELLSNNDGKPPTG